MISKHDFEYETFEYEMMASYVFCNNFKWPAYCPPIDISICLLTVNGASVNSSTNLKCKQIIFLKPLNSKKKDNVHFYQGNC